MSATMNVVHSAPPASPLRPFQVAHDPANGGITIVVQADTKQVVLGMDRANTAALVADLQRLLRQTNAPPFDADAHGHLVTDPS